MSKLHAAIAQRFCQPEWATFFEVRDATGFAGAGRSADAVAMNCYPSRGLEIHGFEVKAVRSDWLRELKAPAKSAAVQKYCDRWWIVTTEDVIKGDLFPPTWGLLLLTGKGLQISTQAPKLDAAPLDRNFMAAMFRASAKHTESVLPSLLEGEKQRLRAELDERVRQKIEHVRGEGVEAARLIARIKDETGINLAEYETSSNIIPAIKFALGAQLHGYEGLKSLVRGARTVIEAADKVAGQHGIKLD